MRPGFVATKGLLERKPRHGQPCNRCGICCIGTPCSLAQHVFQRGADGPCPALQWDGTDSVCGLVKEPARYAIAAYLRGGWETAEAAKVLIGSATGCDCRVNGEPGDESFYEFLRNWDAEHREQVRRAKKIWGITS